jgi:hypothetical protein
MMMAIKPLKLLCQNAQNIPMDNSKIPPNMASDFNILPLGKARSGLSVLSKSWSNTSLKTTPPAYKHIVDMPKNRTELMSIKLNKNPTIDMPAKTSVKDVMTFAGRINSMNALIFAFINE